MEASDHSAPNMPQDYEQMRVEMDQLVQEVRNLRNTVSDLVRSNRHYDENFQSHFDQIQLNRNHVRHVEELARRNDTRLTAALGTLADNMQQQSDHHPPPPPPSNHDQMQHEQAPSQPFRDAPSQSFRDAPNQSFRDAPTQSFRDTANQPFRTPIQSFRPQSIQGNRPAQNQSQSFGPSYAQSSTHSTF